MPFTVESIAESGEALCEAVYALLRAHNEGANPAFWEVRGREENQPVPIHLFAFDGHGGVIGGLMGSTQFAWLKVDIMAVAESARGGGTGRALLERAEAIGRGERGCRYAYVDTMDYQAPEFYEKAGYRIAGQLDDWDSHGHRKFFLVKTL